MKQPIKTLLASLLLITPLSSLARDLNLPVAGMNLNGISYYSTAIIFNNCALLGNKWISQNINADQWDDKRQVSVDNLGYPTSLLDNQKTITLAFTHNDSHYPAGEYSLTWKGKGNLKISGSNPVVKIKEEPNNIMYNVTKPTDLGLIIELKSTDPSDPVHDIVLQLPNTQNNPSSFFSEYVNILKPFGVLRFMGWQSLGSTRGNWPERTPKNYFHQGSGNGAAYEYMIELCNELHCDLWICIPHKATKDYQLQLAQLIKDTLNPNLRVWVEYSNEVWNFDFSQTKWLDKNKDVPGKNLPRKVAHKSAEIWNNFQSVFGNEMDSRVIKVGARQAANLWAGKEYLNELKSLTKKGKASMPDVLAITHYFGGDTHKFILKNNYHKLTKPEEVAAAKDTIFDYIKNDIQTLSSPGSWWTDYSSLAKEYNLPLVSYEGGPHIVATGENVNDKDLTKLLIEIGRDPRMGDCITLGLDAWKKIGGKTPVSLGDISTPSKWGSWGFKEFYNQPLGDPNTPGSAHKMRALLNWIDSQKPAKS